MKVKHIFLVILGYFAFAVSGNAQEDLVNNFFKKYSENEYVTSVYISPRFFSMFKQMDLSLEDKEAEAIGEMIEDLSSLRILVSEENGKAMYEEFTNTFQKSDYELLMRINNKGQDEVDFLIKEEADQITELILLIGGEETDFVLLSFVGNIDLDKVSKLSESFDKKQD